MGNKILFLGDLYDDFDFIPDDIETVSDWAKENETITILNLESPIGPGIGKAVKKRGPNLVSSATVIDVRKRLHVVGVCLANNHMMDYGAEALENTISLLDYSNIRHTGAGMNVDEALKPMVVAHGDQTISVLNFGWDVEKTIYAGGG